MDYSRNSDLTCRCGTKMRESWKAACGYYSCVKYCPKCQPYLDPELPKEIKEDLLNTLSKRVPTGGF
jgi:hypothetical protein